MKKIEIPKVDARRLFTDEEYREKIDDIESAAWSAAFNAVVSGESDLVYWKTDSAILALTHSPKQENYYQVSHVSRYTGLPIGDFQVKSLDEFKRCEYTHCNEVTIEFLSLPKVAA